MKPLNFFFLILSLLHLRCFYSFSQVGFTITPYAKKADVIMKGKLENNPTALGEKFPTDFNALANEYIRVSHDGMRTKVKSFNAEYKTDFDPHLPRLHVKSFD